MVLLSVDPVLIGKEGLIHRAGWGGGVDLDFGCQIQMENGSENLMTTSVSATETRELIYLHVSSVVEKWQRGTKKSDIFN